MENEIWKDIVEFEEKKKLPTGSCFFGHKWTKWETFNAEFRTFAGNKYTDLRQKRYCIKCNKLQIIDY